MEKKFSEGKWVNNTPIDSNGYQTIETEDGLNVATCYGYFERSIPNAKLIASAPEMFEMLRELLYKITDEYSKEKDEIEQLLIKITE